MKCKDIMIGDIIRFKDSGELIKVSGITRRRIGWSDPKVLGGLYPRWRNIGEFEPVLIREVYSSLSNIPGLMPSNDTSNKDIFLFRGKRMTYLHELQNTYYAITGKDIEFKI